MQILVLYLFCIGEWYQCLPTRQVISDSADVFCRGPSSSDWFSPPMFGNNKKQSHLTRRQRWNTAEGRRCFTPALQTPPKTRLLQSRTTVKLFFFCRKQQSFKSLKYTFYTLKSLSTAAETAAAFSESLLLFHLLIAGTALPQPPLEEKRKKKTIFGVPVCRSVAASEKRKNISPLIRGAKQTLCRFAVILSESRSH